MNAKLPADSLIRQFLPADYMDVVDCTVNSASCASADDIQVAFWTTKPRWVNLLFKLRNWLVKPFGLKGDDDGDAGAMEASIRSGGSYRIMSVSAKSANETVICLDDKHLKAYMSVYLSAPDGATKRVSVITLVHYHSWLGRAYFFFIRPFHYLVAKGMLKYVLKSIG